MFGNKRRNKIVDWTLIVMAAVTLALFAVIVMLAITMSVRADGTVSDDDYRIGIDAGTAQYHRLYVPVLMEGNRTQVDASFVLLRAGSGSPRFSIEFLDNMNFELRQRGNTHYERYTTGSTVGPTTSFTTSFVLDLEQGWPNGIYWFCVDKETEANDWCFITWSVAYVTDELGNGALVEQRFEGVEASVQDVTRDVELVDARAAALEGALHALDQELAAQVLALQLVVEKANFTQREDFLDRLNNVVLLWYQRLNAVNDTLTGALEGLDEVLRAELYNITAEVERAAAELNATVEDLDATVRADHARTAALEARLVELERALGLAERALNDTRASVAALDNETAAAPGGASPAVGLAMGGVAGAAAGVTLMMWATRPYRKKKEG